MKALPVVVAGTTTPPLSKAASTVPTESKVSGTATGNVTAFSPKVDVTPVGLKTPVTAPVNVTPAASKVPVLVTAAVNVAPAVSKVPVPVAAVVNATPPASKVPVLVTAAVNVAPAVSKVPVPVAAAVNVTPTISKVPLTRAASETATASVGAVPALSEVALGVVPVVSKASVDVVPVPVAPKASVAVAPVPVPVVSKASVAVVPVPVPVVSKASVDVVPVPVVSKASVDVVPVPVPVISKASVDVVPVPVPVVSKASVDVVPVPVVSKASLDAGPVGRNLDSLAPINFNLGKDSAGVVMNSSIIGPHSGSGIAVNRNSTSTSSHFPVNKISTSVAANESDSGLIVPVVSKEIISGQSSYSDESDSSIESESESDFSISSTPANEAKQQLEDVKAEIQRLVEDGERSAQAAAKRAEVDAERMRSKAAAAEQMDELAKIELVTIYQNREEVMKQIGRRSLSSERNIHVVDSVSSQSDRQPVPVARLKGPMLTANTAKETRYGNQFELSDEDDDFSTAEPEYLDEKSTFTSSFDLSQRSHLVRDKDKESNVSSLAPANQKLSPSVVNPMTSPSSMRALTPPSKSVPLYGSISVPTPVIGNSPLPVLSGSLLSGGRRTSGSSLAVPSVSTALPMSPQSAAKFPGQSTSVTESSRGKMWGVQSEVKPSIASQNQSESQMKGKEADDDSNLDFDTSSWDEDDDEEEND